ncbi:MAG: Spy/CpxP family protein refolding chaperone, partial [Rhodoferax sp.]|nr:Spy/CpxP family protein refolding chaperone [Rhodoferax sp.]
MKTSLKLSLITGLLLAAGFAYSQGPMSGQCDGMGQPGAMQGHTMKGDRMGKLDPARMQARIDQRNTALKAQLKLTPTQEPAWTAYTDAMKAGAGMMSQQRPDPAEIAKLTTPERLDKMQQLRAQRMGDMSAAMDQHTVATKALYAALTPEQQKVFDAAATPGQHRGAGQKP